MKYYRMVVKVDYNDADYATEISKVSEQELDNLKPLFALLKKEGYHNFWYGNMRYKDDDPHQIYPSIDSELIEDFGDNYCPYCEYGFHTVKEVTVTPWVESERLV